MALEIKQVSNYTEEFDLLKMFVYQGSVSMSIDYAHQTIYIDYNIEGINYSFKINESGVTTNYKEYHGLTSHNYYVNLFAFDINEGNWNKKERVRYFVATWKNSHLPFWIFKQGEQTGIQFCFNPKSEMQSGKEFIENLYSQEYISGDWNSIDTITFNLIIAKSMALENKGKKIIPFINAKFFEKINKLIDDIKNCDVIPSSYIDMFYEFEFTDEELELAEYDKQRLIKRCRFIQNNFSSHQIYYSKAFDNLVEAYKNSKVFYNELRKKQSAIAN